MDAHTYTYRDLTFGEGTDLILSEVDGLAGYEARTGDRQLPRGHGSIPGQHYVEAKQILLRFFIGGGVEAVETLTAGVREAFQVTEDSYPLTFARPGMPDRLIRCRPVSIARTETPQGAKLAEPSVALFAADPRIYSADEHTVVVPLYTPSGGGANLPFNFPVNWAAGAVLEAVATNDGTADAYPTLRFLGPTVGTVTGVTIANQTTGESITISAAVATGQTLTFDGTAFVTGSGEQVVSLDGATRYGDWEQPREPLRLIPGDNVLRFTLTGTSTDARAVVSFHDTWLS